MDKKGTPATLKQILFSAFGKDIDTIIKLRKLNRESKHYNQQKTALKNNLQCYSPAALLYSREKGNVIEIKRTGLMQLDFDQKDISEYDIEELKRCVFGLPFIAFCGLSCSGDGFYALALIEEPHRLTEYANHCFNVFVKYGIKPDTSKGRNATDLRYLSYDANMLVRENPKPLRISHSIRQNKPQTRKPTYPSIKSRNSNTGLINSKLKELAEAQIGCRWATVQNVAYTLGGLGDMNLIYKVKSTIDLNRAFTGQEMKYYKCAEDCFKAGLNKPL